MTHRPRSRPKGRRKPWTAFLAALLGALTSVVAAAAPPSFVGHLAVADHGSDARATAAKPAAVRSQASDAALNGGGLDDPGAALAARDHDPVLWTASLALPLPWAFGLPVSAARTRDGRSRAPPRA